MKYFQGNTMLILKDKDVAEIECQYELSNKGCDSMVNQLDLRKGYLKKFNLLKIEDFDCQRSRIIQRFKFTGKAKIPHKFYQKKTLNINDEPYYFWTEISRN